jgi:hypothetical protein
MSTPDLAPDIANYLNPNYWNGHSLGAGPMTYSADKYSFWSTLKGFKAFKNDFNPEALEPLDTFDEGGIFEPDEYDPGTFVYMGQESLRGAAVIEDYEVAEVAELPLPERPQTYVPEIGGHMTTYWDRKRRYVNTGLWGVVLEGRRSNYLVSTLASTIVKGEGGVEASHPFTRHGQPIKVGEINHHFGTSSLITINPETVSRINQVHVIDNNVA